MQQKKVENVNWEESNEFERDLFYST